MKFAPQQQDALDRVHSWMKGSSEQVFHLFGYAGTGKTTLAKHFAEGVNGDVLFGAFTGKAAHVLQSKGCPGASTIHSYIYHSRDRSRKRLKELEHQRNLLAQELRSEFNYDDEKIAQNKRIITLDREIRKEADNSDQPNFVLNLDSPVRDASLVIIDECSMVDERMGEDLLSFGCKVLVLGDPAQLPPVGGEGFFTKDVQPDVMLSEIHRQAADNPIIRMATEVREQQPLSLGEYGDNCRVIDGKVDDILSFDQVLVGKNDTRHRSNDKLRRMKGIDREIPVVGDRLVCLKNNHDLGLLNGAIFEVTDACDQSYDRKLSLSVRPEGEMASVDVVCHDHHFLGQEKDLKWFEKKEAEMFDYGYALTVHKAQGSQWNKVALMDESFCFRKDRWKWLYTGITRAAEEVTVVRMP